MSSASWRGWDVRRRFVCYRSGGSRYHFSVRGRCVLPREFLRRESRKNAKTRQHWFCFNEMWAPR